MAQFPDIVPPQVQVTATYPGAGAEVVEATVAQPIESQVVGVDNMLYMKSTSGNDGSYTLTVSFRGRHRSGHQHRQCAEPRHRSPKPSLPSEVKRSGVSVKQEILGADAGHRDLFAENERTTRCSCPTTRPSTYWTTIKRVPGVGDAFLFGRQRLFHADRGSTSTG